MFTACDIMHGRCCLPTASSVHYITSCKHKSSAPEDGRNYRPKQVELIEIINKPLLLRLVGYLYYWQMGFNSVFKGLSIGTIVAFKSFFSTFRCNMVYSLRTVRVADFLAVVKPWTSHVRSSANHSSVNFVCVQDTWHPKMFRN